MVGQLLYYLAELGIALGGFGVGAGVVNMIDRPGDIDPETGKPRGMSLVGVISGAAVAGVAITAGSMLINTFMIDGFPDLFPQQALPSPA